MDGTIKGIIFDFGGVFDSKHESLDGFRDAAARYGIEPQAFYDLLYSGPAWRQAKLGEISGDAYWRSVMLSLGHDRTQDVTAFRERLFAGHELDAHVVRIATQLSLRYPLALLSNATDELESLLETRYGIHHLFRVVINSARVGIAKPDPRAYWLALEGLEVQPYEALFVDDKQRNIDAAKDLGLRTIHFTYAPSLERDLIALGLLPSQP